MPVQQGIQLMTIRFLQISLFGIIIPTLMAKLRKIDGFEFRLARKHSVLEIWSGHWVPMRK
jgi:hypothetical protein